MPLFYAGIYATLLFTMQQIEHTTLYFSACTFLFILVAAIAFNIAGGLTRPSGGYIFFFSTLAVLVGITSKAFLGEPADSNLRRPHLTITVYLVGICMMAVAAYLSRRFSLRRPLLDNVLTPSTMGRAALGCLLLGSFLTVGAYTIDRGQGTAWSALLQINRFNELAVILGTMDAIRRTGGRSTLGPIALASSAVLFIVGGILGYSKEAMFTPIICWALAAASQGVRLSRGRVVGLLLGMAFISYYMVPYSQYGRTQRSFSLFGNIAVATRLLNSLPQVRQFYIADQKREIEEGTGGYFAKPQGLLDRLQMIAPDDMLIDATELHGPIGYYPLIEDMEALVPHVFWPGKPNVAWGNVYAHEAGFDIPDDDYSTGISFSPTGEGYHLAGWLGVIGVCPIVWFIAFIIFDSLCGDVHNSPWGLLTIIFFSHTAPEGYLGGLIYGMFYFSIAITFAALTVGYIMPLVGSLLIGDRRSRHRGPAPLPIRTVRRPRPVTDPSRSTP